MERKVPLAVDGWKRNFIVFTYNKAFFFYFALHSIKGDGGEPNAMEEKKEEQMYVKWYQAKKSLSQTYECATFVSKYGLINIVCLNSTLILTQI